MREPRSDWEWTIRAHPVADHPHVEVPTLLVVLTIAGAVAIIGTVLPARSRASSSDELVTSSWAGSLSLPQRVVRTLSVLTLVLVVVAGRYGADDELENLAPALVVGAGWPLLVAGSLVLGTLWRWLDPWDALARLLTPRETSEPAGHVWPAVALALPWLWFLGVSSQALEPRAIGLALAAYSVVTVAGCLALGRVRWLSCAEPIGLLLSWVGLLPRRRLGSWQPPRGAGALLGTVVGGLLFGVVRRTELWTGVAVRPDAVLWATVGLLGSALLGATSAVLAARVGSAAQQPAVARALVPVVVGVVLAVALARNRLFISVQLLPGLLGDPLGRGWDVLGSPLTGLDPSPLGAAGLVALQLGVVGLAHVVAAASAPRTLVGDARLPAIAVLTGSAVATLWVMSLH